MSRFTDPLIVSPLSDGRTWIILRQFGYDIGNIPAPERNPTG
jgi:hypothetical protein